MRAGRRSTAAQRVQREILRNDAFDRLRAELGGAKAFDEMVGPAGHASSPATSGTDGLGLDDADRAALAVVRHRHPLGGDGGVRLAARRRGRGQPARPDAHRRRRCTSSACDPAPRRGVDLLRRRQPARRARPSSSCRESPFDLDDRLAARGRRRPDAPAPTPTPRAARPEQLDRFRTEARHELGAAGTPAARRQDRAAARAVGDRPHGRGGPGPRRVARLARRLRVHQGARRAGARSRSRGDVPVSIVRPSIIESALAEPLPRLDPRLPHGRAGDHLLRPRAAEGVPRRARGHRRRHPRRPRRRRHPRRRRRSGPSRRRAIVQVASGSANPLRLPAARRPRARVVHRAPALRQRRASPSSCPSGRSPAAAACRASSTRAKHVASSAAEKRAARRCRCGASRPTWSAQLEETRVRGRAGARATSSSTARTPSARRSTASTTCSRCGTTLDADDRARRSRSTRASIDWDALRARRASAVGRRSTPACTTTPGRPHARPRADAAARARCSSPERHLAAFDLENTLIASNVVESYSWLATRRLPADDRLRFVAADARGGAASARRSTAATAATSSATSTAATRAPRSTQIDEDAAEMFSASDPHQVVPGRASAACASTGALGHRTVLITGALDFVVEPLRPLFDDDRRAPSSRSNADGTLHRRARRRPADRRGPRPDRWPTTATPKACRLDGVGRLRRLDVRPADARGRRLPGRGEPRDRLAAHRPQAGLARRAVGQGARRRRGRCCRSARPLCVDTPTVHRDEAGGR